MELLPVRHQVSTLKKLKTWLQEDIDNLINDPASYNKKKEFKYDELHLKLTAQISVTENRIKALLKR